MASTINASTTGGGGVITTADASGTLALQANGTTVATLNSTGINAGIQVAANAAPAFSAYASAVQTLTNATYTKIAFNTKTFDTNTNFDTTNYRFTPTVAGYYQVSSLVQYQGIGSATLSSLKIYKHGATMTPEREVDILNTQFVSLGISTLIQMNGTTDYLEIYVAQNVGTSQPVFGRDFSAALVRSA